MSLAARCPACGTVFRVVQDQLRVSDGWVRCGRCAEVFNAIENLVDLDAAGVEPWTALAAEVGASMEEAVSPRRADVRRERSETSEAAARPAAAPPIPAAVGEPRPLPAASPPAAAAASITGSLAADPEERTPPVVMPAFVRRAERAARWRRPAVRGALAAVAALAAIGLVAQMALSERDVVAARWPGSRPLLAGVCALAGCRIEPPRQIDALAVDSSGLSRIEGTPLYRLAVVVRNRATIPLALPALDLTVTDSQGGVIARRVLLLKELGATATAMPAAGEIALHATVRTAERAISGYTIEIFYP